MATFHTGRATKLFPFPAGLLSSSFERSGVGKLLVKIIYKSLLIFLDIKIGTNWVQLLFEIVLFTYYQNFTRVIRWNNFRGTSTPLPRPCLVSRTYSWLAIVHNGFQKVVPCCTRIMWLAISTVNSDLQSCSSVLLRWVKFQLYWHHLQYIFLPLKNVTQDRKLRSTNSLSLVSFNFCWHY